jgi:hypothetical protein
MTGHGELEDPARAAFILFAKPTGLVHVVTQQGQSLGAFEPSLANSAPQQERVTVQEGAIQQAPTLEHLLSGVPTPLQPIAQHPLRQFQSLEARYALNLFVTPDFGRSPETVSSAQGRRVELTSDLKVKVPGYFIRISTEKHYLGGCVKRNAWHAGVLLRDLSSNSLLFDLHIASWWDQWRPCFALYESASGFCRNVCDQPSWKALVAIIYAALAATLVAWLAAAIASAIAAAVLGVLIIIPGVPPPP